MNILFSIVFPTYNRAQLINAAITSVLRQEYRNFELLVIDDGSTDNTSELVARIQEENKNVNITYHYQPNAERAAARNTGLKKSHGNYVMFFDSDDELYPNHLSEAIKFITANPGVEIFHLRYDIRNEEKEKISEGPSFKSPPGDKLIEGNFLSCNGVIIKREVALENLFNEDRELSAAEDWELWLRISIKYPIHYVNTITSAIFNHSDRSVLIINRDKLIRRMEKLMHYVCNNPLIKEKHQKNFNRFRASCYSYVSLHLALAGVHKGDVLKYLLKALAQRPSFVFKKRFFVILKHLV